MQYSITLVAAMALAMVNAVQFTNSAFNGITAGQSTTLTWTGANGPVTITLKDGSSTDLKTVSTVASGQTGGSFTWNVPSTLAQDTYALEITDSSGTPNYSPQFQLIGGATATGTTSGTASVSATGSTSASSIVSSAVSSVSSVVSSQSSAASSSIASVVSSVSSLVNSITSNSTTSSVVSSSTHAASNATTTTGGSSSTKASSTGTKTGSSAAGSSTSTSTGVPNANSAVQMASPLALVFLTFAAIFSLN